LPELHRHVSSLDPCNLIPRARARARALVRRSRTGEISSRPSISAEFNIRDYFFRDSSRRLAIFQSSKAGGLVNFLHRSLDIFFNLLHPPPASRRFCSTERGFNDDEASLAKTGSDLG